MRVSDSGDKCLLVSAILESIMHEGRGSPMPDQLTCDVRFAMSTPRIDIISNQEVIGVSS